MSKYIAGQDHGRVFCNGTELHDVAEVDTDKGVAVVYRKDEHGLYVVEDEEVKCDIVVGKMTFVHTVRGE